ncbi:MAG: enoyl-[acyl-carrier protein] reductase [Candidatus Binatota bacterium]|nr:enoyl-[acyl-carrier protein] reductase [Candidatus Binatota bacterium]
MESKLAELSGEWALVLGASSGFGAAVSLELARHGVNVFGVHLDRRATMANVDRIVAEIRAQGVEAQFFNVNAADAERRQETLDRVEQILAGRDRQTIRTLLHSLAFGALKPFVGDGPEDALSSSQIEMTLDVMASSLVYWTRELVWRGILGQGSRVFAMTSAGSHRCWPGYGAVSAAKAALEAYVRQLAIELAPRGVTVNALRAGVTDTPALRKIPGHEVMIEAATQRNPGGRMTSPEDVAKLIAVFSLPATGWVTGNVIGVDGGEDAVG